MAMVAICLTCVGVLTCLAVLAEEIKDRWSNP